MGGIANYGELARKLAAMHRCTSSDGTFGWSRNNTIGATFQPNNKMINWADFWDQHRLGHILNLSKREAIFICISYLIYCANILLSGWVFPDGEQAP